MLIVGHDRHDEHDGRTTDTTTAFTVFAALPDDSRRSSVATVISA